MIFLATCIILIFPKFFIRFNSANLLDGLEDILGFGMLLFGLLLRISSRGFKSENSRHGHALVKQGPYALVRNPMYLGIILIGLGIVLVLFKWWVAIFFILVFSVRYAYLIVKEEKKLIEHFGSEYRDYMSSVPRLFPRLDGIIKKDLREFIPLKLSWVSRELPSVIGVISAVLFIESWEDIRSGNFNIFSLETLVFLLQLGAFFVLAAYLSGKGKIKCFK